MLSRGPLTGAQGSNYTASPAPQLTQRLRPQGHCPAPCLTQRAPPWLLILGAKGYCFRTPGETHLASPVKIPAGRLLPECALQLPCTCVSMAMSCYCPVQGEQWESCSVIFGGDGTSAVGCPTWNGQPRWVEPLGCPSDGQVSLEPQPLCWRHSEQDHTFQASTASGTEQQ